MGVTSARAILLWRTFIKSRFSTVAAYCACVLIWGTTWLAIKVSLGGMPPIFGAGVRFVVAAALLYALALASRIDLRRNLPPWHLVGVLAVTMFGLNYALTYLAETHLASGLVAVLFGTMPFFIFGFAHVMLGERANRNTLVGAFLALAGVTLISLVGDIRADVLYVAAALLASASSGYANVYLKRYAHAEPLVTLPPAMLGAGVAMTLWGLAFERIDLHLATSPATLEAVAYLAIFGTAIAFSLNHWLLQRISSGQMGLSALMIPVLAVAVGALFGGEVFGFRDVAGALLVTGGVWLSLTRGRSLRLQTAEVRAAG